MVHNTAPPRTTNVYDVRNVFDKTRVNSESAKETASPSFSGETRRPAADVKPIFDHVVVIIIVIVGGCGDDGFLRRSSLQSKRTGQF